MKELLLESILHEGLKHGTYIDVEAPKMIERVLIEQKTA